MKKLVVFVSLVGFITGCTHPAPDRAVVTQDQSPSYPVLGYLKTRDFKVTLSSGPDGVVCTVINHSGEILVKNVSMDALQASHPDIYRILDTSNADRNGRVLDARAE